MATAENMERADLSMIRGGVSATLAMFAVS